MLFAAKKGLFPYRLGLFDTGLRPPFESLQYKTATERGTRDLVNDLAQMHAAVRRSDSDADVIESNFREHWPELEAVIAVVEPLARKNLTRFAQYGEGGYLATIAERKAAQAVERAEAQELRAEAFRALLFSLLRHEDSIGQPGYDVKLLRDEMTAFRRVAENEEFDDFAEAEPYQGEAEGMDRIDPNM